MAALSVNIATDNMLLLILFLPGALATCPQESNLFITVPQMEALSGSCLQIPCNFSAEPEPLVNSNYVGLWTIKVSNPLPKTVVFSSKNPVNSYPMNITGNLSEKDCTTLFSSLIINYTNNYYFRIESKAYKATAICDPLQITVKDSPPSPRIEISGDLKEKESVTISCSASTPCPHSPPKLTWNLQQDPPNNIEENTDRTFTTKIQKTITLSDANDGFTINCSATYPVNEGREVKTAEERKTLSVSYAPKNTSVSISPSGLVSAGSWVNLTCSSRAKPPASFSWFKNSKDGAISVAEGVFYSVKVTSVTDIEDYYCMATNKLGNETSSTIHLNVKAESPDPSLPLGPVIGGIIGIIVLISLVVCVCILCRRPIKLTHSTQRLNQSQTGEELTVKEPARRTEQEEEKEEDIHYGEIDFSKLRPELSSEQDRGQQQDTLYAQVKVSQTANSRTQTADGPEDLYAQVKTK
ncbi:vascular cell adhesion protein 1-like isoform X2 [Perca fluviatilis]|uniref:vascular cell adhesion protein 1-like isoform X2 n=1 Tax=Perca fluviatilis TaxID=8168 RepID=UPI00196682A2|nr:vascular cell adhesion protein 1-like isoform X2 [Perca fluviatilis]